MCGRFTRAKELLEVEQRFAVPVGGVRDPKRYNIAPSQKVPVIVRRKEQAELLELTWGFLAPWSTAEKKIAMVNIRAETFFTRPAFRTYLEKYRCLIPADGFYEWTGDKGNKIPYRFTLDSGLFGIAGIYRDDTFCLITVEANSVVAPVHHRMPVIVPREKESSWLNPAASSSDYQSTLAPYPVAGMASYRVTPVLNSGKIEDPKLIEPVAENEGAA